MRREEKMQKAESEYIDQRKEERTMAIEDYVSYGLAAKLKMCGYDKPCHCYYDKEYAADDEYWLTIREEEYNWNGLDSVLQISAPTLWQTQKWLREAMVLDIDIATIYSHEQRIAYQCLIHGHDNNGYFTKRLNYFYPSYEAALSAGIDAALELIIKEKQ